MSVLKKDSGCLACPYHYVGAGFTPDYYPENPKIAVLLEAPGGDEILEHSPLVGRAGKWWTKKLIHKLRYKREDVLIANTLRCRPPENVYPTGWLRKQAETCCRQYDDKHGDKEGNLIEGGIKTFNPTMYIVTYHPSGILRTPALYRPTLRAVELAFKFADKGERPCVLMGDTAKSLVAPWLKGGIKRWNRHYFYQDGWTL